MLIPEAIPARSRGTTLTIAFWVSPLSSAAAAAKNEHAKNNN